MPANLDEESAALLATARLVAARLERLSVDSIWARRASGMRGSLLQMIDQVEQNPALLDSAATRQHLGDLNRLGFRMIENAAREIPYKER
ncbi:MAG TPA: hypothetical protein VIO61_02115 [Anaerolineaceae bacterium]